MLRDGRCDVHVWSNHHEDGRRQTRREVICRRSLALRAAKPHEPRAQQNAQSLYCIRFRSERFAYGRPRPAVRTLRGICVERPSPAVPCVQSLYRLDSRVSQAGIVEWMLSDGYVLYTAHRALQGTQGTRKRLARSHRAECTQTHGRALELLGHLAPRKQYMLLCV